MRGWIVCVGVACAGVAVAGPRGDVRETYELAAQLDDDGEYEQALGLVEQGLAIAPKDLELLGLKGTVLLKLRDYTRALAAYRAYLDAGVTGANRREAQKIVNSLGAVQSTFLQITLANGPADVYLDSKTQGLFCRAEPSCSGAILPGEYKAIVERPGFERWSGPVDIEPGKSARLVITLVERPSRLIVRAEPSGARVTVDDVPYDASAEVAAGEHRIAVSLEGHVTEQREVNAHEGKPIELDIVLTPLVAAHVVPAGAALLLDGKPVAIEGDGIAIPRGPHVLVARAPGFQDRRIEIPARRGPDYRLAVELEEAQRAERGPAITQRRRLALALGGVALVAASTGVMLGLQSGRLEADLETRKAGERRGFGSAFSYGVALFATGFAIHFWIGDTGGSQVAAAPRVGRVSGVALAMRF